MTTKSGDPGKQKEERLNERLQRRFPVNHLSRVKMIFFSPFLSLPLILVMPKTVSFQTDRKNTEF